MGPAAKDCRHNCCFLLLPATVPYRTVSAMNVSVALGRVYGDNYAVEDQVEG